MLKHSLKDLSKTDFWSKDFQAAFDFLGKKGLASLPVGRYDINEHVFAFVQEYKTESVTQVPWEAHERYCDMQYVVEGCERFLVTPKAMLVPSGPFNEAGDIGFYQEADICADELILNPGDLAIITTDEAHKPRCIERESGPVKKIVVKVPQSAE